MRLDFLGDVHPALDLLLYFVNKRTVISRIGEKGLRSALTSFMRCYYTTSDL